MSYTALTLNEKDQVEVKINEILGSSIMTDILKEKTLISVNGSRREIFLISNSDIKLLAQIESNPNCKLIHARVKLGFFIHNSFRVGIESLSYLASLTKKKIQLNPHNARKFIYGKDIEIIPEIMLEQMKQYRDGETVMVFTSNEIPIGYAKINLKTKKLQNLVDIGIYLRSEKSAF
jgi:60S ribosome subunit biogenesis protein NIP7